MRMSLVSVATTSSGSGPASGGTLFTIGRGRFHDFLDPSLAQEIDRPPPLQARVLSEHEVHPHPGIFHPEGFQNLADAGH